MTLHHKASAAPASEPAHTLLKDGPNQGLICPAEQIFDQPRIRAALADAIDATPSGQSPRASVVAILAEANAAGRAAIAAAFKDAPLNARPLTRAYAYLTDGLVTETMWVASEKLHPLATPTEGERLSVFAVGGYGRGEMAPHSDVDLLFLTPYKITPWAESAIEEMLYILWDLRLKVGHSSRTIRDCIRLGREDYTIRTALLEQRFLAGHAPMAGELKDRLWDELFKSTARDFVEAKLAERTERHKKQGQRYVLEPNVKEGKGGLRDLQSLYWISKYVHRAETTEDLLNIGVFRQDEYDDFVSAEDFLWAVRAHLHLITNRASDQLTFDMQVEVAERMGYAAHGGRMAVEHFMQDFFRHATTVGELTRIFLTALEDAHVKSAPSLARLFRRRKPLREGFVLDGNRLNVDSEATFTGDKLNMLRVFEEGLRTGYTIHPNAMRMVQANLSLIDDDMRANREAQRIFMDLMLKHGNPERALRRMNELGVLSAFMPEFEPIVAMMQFNMYHHYTVDEHTIQVISTLAQIERGELVEELPVASGILKEGVNRKVLYLALLLHDIGKGRDEDHSILGAKIARKIAPRMGLKEDDCETVEWLVRYHLLMSDMAQKRDLADPRTVRDFAKAVKTKKRLDLLTVLTVCDIRGVGPGVWNNWKAVLLRSLYKSTAEALETGLEAVNQSKALSEARKALRAELADWDTKTLKAEIARHYPSYWRGLQTSTHVLFANMLNGIKEGDVAMDLEPDPDRDATRACFAMEDHPGIFSRLAGALALVGANVVDARTYTTKDGYATAAFWIQDIEGAPYEVSRLPRLRTMIDKTLKGKVVARDAFRDRDKLKKRERKFVVPTSITFDNEGSDIYTIIEVDTRDRPGLLFDLAQMMARSNVYIASAVIATYGAQVVDTFYVKDMFGLKFTTESKLRTLEKRLREAIEKGAERARE